MSTPTTTRDQFGLTHRHGCPMPGYQAHTATMPGVLLLRCEECDAQRLTKGTDQ